MKRNIYTKPATVTFGRIEMPKAVCSISSSTDPVIIGGDAGDGPGGGVLPAKPFDNSSFFFTDNEQNAKE